MSITFPITFDDGRAAAGVRVEDVGKLGSALASIGVSGPRPVMVLVGGAGGLSSSDLNRLRPAFRAGLVPVVQRLGAVGVSGGTRSGVMRAFGETRREAEASFPLLAVAAAGTVRLPSEPTAADRADLDPGHTHVLLVPGDDWGDEAPWLAWTASALAGSAPSVTLLVNGGEISYSDVERSLQVDRPVIVVAGSGRTADELAAAVRGLPADERAVALAASGLVQAVPIEDAAGLAHHLVAALSGPAQGSQRTGSTRAHGG